MTTLPHLNDASIHGASIDDVLANELSQLRDRQLERQFRRTAHRRGAIVETDHGPAVDFSSNDYLGLASDRRIVDAAVAALHEHGVGAGAARLISGNTPEHEALERDVATFFAAERALTFSSGYAANVGIIPALVTRGDAIFADALNHASLIDGCRLSRAAVHVYAHANHAALGALLDRHRGGARRALIVTDGLFSMDGDVAPIAEIAELARQFDAWTFVDDAHAAGVLGEDGRGTASDAGSDAAQVTVGTLGKAFGSAGAFVYGSATLIQYLLNRARSFVFSTAMLPAQAAAARAALRIAAAEPERRRTLADNSRALRDALSRANVTVAATGDGPIVPVLLGDEARTMRIGATLARSGFLVGAVRPPTVPPGGSRLRITASAAHTQEQIDGLAGALAAAIHG